MNLPSSVLLTSAVCFFLLVPPSSLAQTVSKAQTKCITALNKSGTKVMATQSKENARCVKSAGRGLEPDASACLVADRKGKVGKARAKTTGGETKKCTETPVFGFTGADTVNSVAVGAALGIVDDVFGVDLNAAMAVVSDDRTGASCQAAVAKIYLKLASAELDAFNSCKRRGLKDGTITSSPLLEGCFDAIALDARKKITKAVGKLASVVAKKCAAVDLPTVFPGSCVGQGDFVDCVDRRIGCRVCLMLNGMDGLAEDCDLFDDGANDGSCVDPSLTTTTTTTSTTTLPPVLSNYEVTIGIGSAASSVGALSFTVNFATDAVSASCTGLLPTAVAISNENPAGTLNVSVFDVFGFAAPVDLVRCSLSAFSSNFDIVVGLLVDTAGVPIIPTPSVVVTDVVTLP